MDKNKCSACGSDNLERGSKKIKFQYKKKKIALDQPGEYCNDCGEGIVAGSDIQVTQKTLHDFRASIDGFLTSDEIRSIRKRLKLTQKQASDIFGGGDCAFSRYERGKIRQTRALDLLLRFLDKHPEFLNEFSEKVEAA